jgi:DNA-binding response OmpR family regulator
MAYLELENTKTEETYRDAHLEIDYRRPALVVDARPVRLTRKEYELIALLARNAGEIVPRDVLLMRVWGYSREIRTRTLDVHIRRLRKKLGAYGDEYIETIFGVGYRFQPYREVRPFRLYGEAIGVVA